MPEVQPEQAESVLSHFDDRRSNLIALLQEVQATFHYLPQDVLRRIARKLRVPMAEIYQVATFYRCFSLVPRGKHLVQVCAGTACHVGGAERILERVQTETGAGTSRTSPDMEFTVEPVRCLGCCGLAPVVRVDRDTHGHMDVAKVRTVVNRYKPRPAKRPATAKKEGVADD